MIMDYLVNILCSRRAIDSTRLKGFSTSKHSGSVSTADWAACAGD